MPIIIRYSWFLIAGMMLLNIAIWRYRLSKVVEMGRATPGELRRFIKWSCICLVGGPSLLGLISAAAGWSSPFCAGFMEFTNVPKTLVSLVTIASWLGLLWWLWRGNGADFLSRVAPAMGQRPAYDKSYSPKVVRLTVTIFVVVVGIGTALTWRTIPGMREVGCQATTFAGSHPQISSYHNELRSRGPFR